mmetsp:Transcript_48921/g.52828  ORF Transcript_48921/g.52828 Transcript_48921/m.52828 type:complete len:420 (+) Transcript_48921:175-1434(+)
MMNHLSNNASAILRIQALPRSGPFPTLDPFLFAVYHVDDYPADQSGGRMEFVEDHERGNGSDFNPSAPYRMYHGDRVAGFPQHPHRGFETITATIHGLVDHADSMGNAGRYGEGDVQWMTAGKGIVHGEMFPLVSSETKNALQFFQIWLNLPSSKKMVEPSFAMAWAKEVPQWMSQDGLCKVTVWAGDYFLGPNNNNKENEDDNDYNEIIETNQTKPPPDSWASEPENDVAVLRIVVQPGGKMMLPKANTSSSSSEEDDGVTQINRSMYLVEGGHDGRTGNIQIDGQTIRTPRVCITMDATKDVSLELPIEATTPTEFLVLQGKPIEEPVVQHGPFVMNTEQEIRQTFSDYRQTKFGGWPWTRDDMVFPQDKGRFALVDGIEIFPTDHKNDGTIDNNDDSSNDKKEKKKKTRSSGHQEL